MRNLKITDLLERTLGKTLRMHDRREQQRQTERNRNVARRDEIQSRDYSDLAARRQRNEETKNKNRPAHAAFRGAQADNRATKWIEREQRAKDAREKQQLEEMLRRTCDPRLLRFADAVIDARRHALYQHGADVSQDDTRVVAQWEGKKLEEVVHTFRSTVVYARAQVERWQTRERPYRDALKQLLERIDAEQLAAEVDWSALVALVEAIPPPPCVCAPRVTLPADDAEVPAELLRALTPGVA